MYVKVKVNGKSVLDEISKKKILFIKYIYNGVVMIFFQWSSNVPSGGN